MDLDAGHAALLIACGVLAGAVNAVAGGGGLLVFPALIALGASPLAANVTNAVGQLPGYASVAWGYRLGLQGQSQRVFGLALPALAGGVAGVAALLLGGRSVFAQVVPFLVLGASGLLAAAPAIARRHGRPGARRGRWTPLAVAAASAYTTYFGAAAGVLFLAVLSVTVDETLQRLNSVNRLLVFAVNLAAAPFVIALLPVQWVAALLLAPASILGGLIGVRLFGSLPEGRLRLAVVSLGLAVGVWLLIRG
jgi:uncharacterized membrane protein YfcA